MHKVPILRNLPRGMIQRHLQLLMTGVTYDLSSDGSELVAYVVPRDEEELHGLRLEESVNTFTMYVTEKCIPSYDHLTFNEILSARDVANKYGYLTSV